MLPLLLAFSCVDAPPPEASSPPPHSGPPDILLVVLDTVRADATQGWGSERHTSPQLAAIAQAGIRFTDVTAPGGWTWPSHASLFTGQPPWVNGAHSAGADRGVALRGDALRVTPMREDLPTLAERLGGAGYRTVALSANRLLSQPLGLTRGFETAEYIGSEGPLSADARVVDRAQAVLAEPDERPLFLFINLMSAHSPYHTTPAEWSQRHAEPLAASPPSWAADYLVRAGAGEPGISFFAGLEEGEPSGVIRYMRGELEIPAEGLALLRDLYDGEVVKADFYLNRLASAWTSVHPDGVVAVTSDHGEAFGEHGLLEHSGAVYPELTQIPLALAAPGRIAAAQTVDAPVQLQDLYPTLLELAGVEDPVWSLLDAAATPRPSPVAAAAWPRLHLADAVGGRFTRGWRLYREGGLVVITGTDGASADAVELYDVSADPGMTRDLSAEQPERAAAMAAAAAAAIPLSLDDAGGVELTGDEVEALRALGYVE